MKLNLDAEIYNENNNESFFTKYMNKWIITS